jgi:hypothetical protein
VTPPALVGRIAFWLGYAGLLPQAAAVSLMAVHPPGAWTLPLAVAYIYASLILSFLGGIWWGFAMRRSEGQGGLAALSVLPSLVPLAILPLAIRAWSWGLVLLGSAILLTLLVDRHLQRTGDAPPNWLRLRAPLSLGLGGLTILAGYLSG